MKRLAAVVAAITATLLVAACGSSSSTGGSSSAPGVTANSITFGTHQPLTGPAAPGYSLIAPASQAYFDYVNAHGGVYGRKIHLIIKNDQYDPTNTVNVIHQLVLQDNVFGIFEGLGTPTHTKVVGFLNAEKVPDVFVSSGCDCWDNGKTQPETYGWFTNYTIEGKILGSYIKKHFAGEKVGVLYQDDDLGKGGLEGLDDAGLKSDIISEQPYQSGTTSLATQMTALKNSGAKVLVEFTVPIYTAIARITSYTLGYSPQLVVSSIGIDPTTIGGLLASISKGKVSGDALMDGAISDSYMPSTTDTSNKWIAFFHKILLKYDAKAPWDFNTEYGMASAYTLVQSLVAAGKNLTRQDFTDAINKYGKSWTGPLLVPFRYTTTEHGGMAGVEMAKIVNSQVDLFGGPLTTGPDATSPITAYTGTQPAPPTSGVPSAASVTK
jgi:ABC-type branched-subunit amino acid transport system substrate-binding protein